MVPRGKSDDELLLALRDADGGALAELYERHAGAMLTVARRMLGSALEAEDVLQDVFLEIWRRATDYEAERGSARTWLFLRLRSRALDRRRALVRAPTSPWEPEGETVQAPSSLNEEAMAVRRAVRSLPPELGHLVALGYEQGQSSREMAATTRVPIGTVKSRLARALSVLRNALDEDTRAD